MSANAAAQNIPIRRIQISHPSEIPHDYGTTPGGTMFSTTPGGTRIIYDRLFLLKCRDSPLSKTPPPNLPDIPGVTTPDRSPAKHMIGKIPEESAENGKSEGPRHRYPAPSHFQFPIPCFNANEQLQVPFPYSVKNGNGSRLVQYRRRQSLAQMKHDAFNPSLPFNNMSAPPPLDPHFRGIFSPSPIPMDHPSYGPPPPLFIHPIQGPTGPIFDQRHVGYMSPLALWRQSQSQSMSSEMNGYTTAKTPGLRSSFEGNGEGFPQSRGYGRGRGMQRPPFDNRMINGRGNLSNGMHSTPHSAMHSSYSSAYDSSFSDNDLVMVIPDDPSIIAYKPLQKHKMDDNANYFPPFSPIPNM